MNILIVLLERFAFKFNEIRNKYLHSWVYSRTSGREDIARCDSLGSRLVTRDSDATYAAYATLTDCVRSTQALICFSFAFKLNETCLKKYICSNVLVSISFSRFVHLHNKAVSMQKGRLWAGNYTVLSTILQFTLFLYRFR